MLKNWDTYLHLHLYLQRKRKENQSDPLGSQKWPESHLICKYVRRELEHIFTYTKQIHYDGYYTNTVTFNL